MFHKLKKHFLFFVVLPGIGYSQAERLVINSGYMVMANGTAATPTYLVVANPATNAITRNSGGIISEKEYDMIQWNIGTATAGNSYILPFQYSTTSYIPLTLTISNAGVGAGGVIKFSTWHTINDNWTGVVSTTGPPSGVTNMYPATLPGSPSNTDNSYNVVDRFWIIDANSGYTTLPNPLINFTYLNSTNAASEVTGLNNPIDGLLLAQRFNTAISTWGDYAGQAATTIATGGTSTVTTGTSNVSAAGFFRAWTLSSQSSPLPIQLTSFTATCNSENALIKWTSATEINNNYYTIERTSDGVRYITVAIIKGAGTSNTSHDYSVIDYNPLPGTSYYRISQTDYDGNTTIKDIISFSGCENATNTINADNAGGVINISINSMVADYYTITLFTVLGQSMLTENHSVAVGSNNFRLYPTVSDGIYILNIKSGTITYNKKLFIGR